MEIVVGDKVKIVEPKDWKEAVCSTVKSDAYVISKGIVDLIGSTGEVIGGSARDKNILLVLVNGRNIKISHHFLEKIPEEKKLVRKIRYIPVFNNIGCDTKEEAMSQEGCIGYKPIEIFIEDTQC